ncbi:hypothetical protein [Microbacterium gorillae]|uniref:hypothetical protein n=1 Tax=Microbacterium gorillae TaxID=1231063 RepID=UPI003D98913A
MTESATGSFAFPPRSFGSAQELIDFFESAPISDRILSNADHAYRKWREDQINEEVRAAYDVYGNDPKIVAGARENPINSEREARIFVNKVRREADAKRPVRVIDQHRLRNVLRAHQIWAYSGTLPTEDEEREVLEYKTQGSDFTIVQVVESNSTREWLERALTDSDLAAVDAMNRVAQALEEQAGP